MAEIPRSAAEIHKILLKLSEELFKAFSSWEKVAFIGIRSGGELIARNLVKRLEEKTGQTLPLGVLDITLYRDDLTRLKGYPEVRSTDIPFAVDGRDIILVDDVLYTGRSVRSAIDHIVDMGRPGRIYLLVLYDRGGRELPIQADFIGKKISLPDDQVIKIEAAGGTDSLEGVLVTGGKR